MNRRVAGGLRALVGIILLALIISRLDLSTLTIARGPRFVAGIVAALCLLPLAQALSALRWSTILGEGTPPWSYLTRLYFIGLFFGLFLPTSIGGDAVRMVAAGRNLPRKAEAITSVMVDRVLGVLALAGYLVAGLIVAPSVLGAAGATLGLSLGGRRTVALAGLALIVAIGGVVAWRRPATRRWLGDALTLVRRVLATPRTLVPAAALAVVVQGLYIACWFALAQGLNLGVPATVFLVTVPLVSLGAMLPITVSGLGIREGIWLLLLRPYAVLPTTIVAFSLLYFGCLLVVGAAGGILFIAKGTDLQHRPPGGTPPGNQDRE